MSTCRSRFIRFRQKTDADSPASCVILSDTAVCDLFQRKLGGIDLVTDVTHYGCVDPDLFPSPLIEGAADQPLSVTHSGIVGSDFDTRLTTFGALAQLRVSASRATGSRQFPGNREGSTRPKLVPMTNLSIPTHSEIPLRRERVTNDALSPNYSLLLVTYQIHLAAEGSTINAMSPSPFLSIPTSLHHF